MITIHSVRCPRRLGTLLLAAALAVVLGASSLLALPALAAPADAGMLQATAVASAQPATPAATPAATAQPPLGTATVTTTAPQVVQVQVNGSLVNGTAGASATQSLTVTLYAFEHSALASTAPQPMGTFTGTVASGRYSFADVTVPDGGVLLAAVLYDGIYYRNYVVLDPGAIQATLPITIYESTDDPAGLRLQQMHVVIEPAGATANGLEVVALTNGADRTFSGTLQLSLPAGVTGVDFPQAPGQFVVTPDGYSGDVVMRPEGASQILVTFQVPFTDGKLRIEQTLSFAADSVIVISLNTVELSGANLQPMTLQDLPAEYRAYDAGALDKGAQLAFDAKLVPGAATGTQAATTGGAATTPGGVAATLPFLASLPPWAPYVLGAAVLLVVVGVGGWAWQRSRGAEEEEEEEFEEGEESEEAEESEDLGEEAEDLGEAGAGEEAAIAAPNREQLLQAIADLDDAYEAGDFSAGEYKRQRAALKAQLAELGRNDRDQ